MIIHDRKKQHESSINSDFLLDRLNSPTNIRERRREEKRGKLENFKEKLARQREGFAKLQEEIVEAFDRDPDAPMQKIYEITDRYANEYGFSEEDKMLVAGVLHSIDGWREAIKKYGEQYPDSAEFYEQLFGRKPMGRVEVVRGRVALFVRCYDPADFAWAYDNKVSASDKSITDKELEKLEKIGGASLDWSLLPQLSGALTIENTSRMQKTAAGSADVYRKLSAEIQQHEERHAVNRLLKAVWGWHVDNVSVLMRIKEINSATTFDETYGILKAFCQRGFRLKESRVRDEVLAYITTGAFAKPEFKRELMEKLLKPAEQGGLYDYFGKEERRMSRAIVGVSAKVDVTTILEGVMVEEFDMAYPKILEEALDVFATLWEKTHWSIERVAAFLGSYPIDKWKIATERVMEKRGK